MGAQRVLVDTMNPGIRGRISQTLVSTPSTIPAKGIAQQNRGFGVCSHRRRYSTTRADQRSAGRHWTDRIGIKTRVSILSGRTWPFGNLVPREVVSDGFGYGRDQGV